ncbi:MAG: hypothetical protein E7K04_04020 [Helicobacter sp.]|nr:hypothetical protein [Helicobacter sp.]
MKIIYFIGLSAIATAAPYGIIKTTGDKYGATSHPFTAILGSENLILVENLEDPPPKKTPPMLTPDKDTPKVTLGTSTLDEPGKANRSTAIGSQAKARIDGIINSYAGKPVDNMYDWKYKNQSNDIVVNFKKGSNGFKIYHGFIHGDIISRVSARKEIGKSDAPDRGITRVIFEDKGQIDGGIYNYGLGDNHVTFVKGGKIGGSLIAQNSGLNIIKLGDMHLDISHNVKRSYFDTQNKADAIILSSVPYVTHSIQDSTTKKILRVQQVEDINSTNKSKHFQALKFFDGIQNRQNSRIELRLFVDRFNNRGIDPGKREIVRCPMNPPQKVYLQHAYGKSYNDRVVVEAKGLGFIIYPIFESENTCSGGTPNGNGKVNLTSPLTSGSLGLNDGGDRNIEVLKAIKHQNGGTDTEHNIALITIKNNVLSKDHGKDGGSYAYVPGIKIGFDTYLAKLKGEPTDEFGRTNISTTTSATTSTTSTTSSTSTQNTQAQTPAPKVLDYTTFFLDGIKLELDNSTANSALQSHSVNVLPLSFNNLDNRLGEIRHAKDNPKALGSWGRAYANYQNLKLPSKEDKLGFVTAHELDAQGYGLQFGQDYSVAYESGLSQVLGGAIELSTDQIRGVNNKNINSISGEIEGVKNGSATGAELALYHTIIGSNEAENPKEDEPPLDTINGLYIDTIIKAKLVSNKISLHNIQNSQKINTRHLILQNQVGYRFNIDSFGIQPELLIGYGWSSPIKSLTHKRADGTLTTKQNESAKMLKTRAGGVVTYDIPLKDEFKNVRVHFGSFLDYSMIRHPSTELMSNKNTVANINAFNTHSFGLKLDLGANVAINDILSAHANIGGTYLGDLSTLYELNLGMRFSY